MSRSRNKLSALDTPRGGRGAGRMYKAVGTHVFKNTKHGKTHVQTRPPTTVRLYANSNTSHEKGAIEMKGCRPLDTCAQASTQVTTMGKRSTESSFSCPPHQLACEPDGAVYSGTLSGTRARLYLNSMVAFSAALSAAPRSKEPAWVGVIAGDWRWGWLPTGMEGGRSPAGAFTIDFTGRSEHCCVGMVERRSPCRHARTDVVSELRVAGQAACAGVQWVYRWLGWAMTCHVEVESRGAWAEGDLLALGAPSCRWTRVRRSALPLACRMMVRMVRP